MQTRAPHRDAPVTIFRSIIFFLWFAIVTAVIALFALPVLMLPRHLTVRISQLWSQALLWGLRIFARLDYERRGDLPQGSVLVAAKHMSMWDTLAIYLLLDDAAIVVKRELLNIPFYVTGSTESYCPEGRLRVRNGAFAA